MRIAYILNSLGMGGAERQVLAVAERLAARGHSVSVLVLCPQADDALSTPLPVEFLNARKNPWIALRCYRQATLVLSGFGPDIIHGNNYYGNLCARMLGRTLSTPNFRVPVVSCLHNVYEGGLLRMGAYRCTDGLSAANVAVCERALQRYVRLSARKLDKCQVIVNGIDLSAFTPDSGDSAEQRSQLNITDEFVWLAVGRVAAAKDYPNLLHAFARIHAQAPRTRLCVAGDGPPDYFYTLRRWAGEQHLDDAIHWLGLRHDIPALLDLANAFVLGSAWEGMPLAIGEAMAMGKPVVATNVGGVRELLGHAGLLVPPSDPAQLAEAMLAVMQMPAEMRARLGAEGRERIRGHFDIENTVLQWESLYESLVSESRLGRELDSPGLDGETWDTVQEEGLSGSEG